MKLEIELVPSTCWFSNLRSELSTKDWGTIKHLTFTKANYVCEICSGKGHRHPVECHEIWDYDDLNHIQTLKGTIALCPNCHMVKHMGLQIHLGRFDKAFKHFRKINNLSVKDANDYIHNAFKIHHERSKYDWDLDVSWLTNRFPNMKLKSI